MQQPKFPGRMAGGGRVENTPPLSSAVEVGYQTADVPGTVLVIPPPSRKVVLVVIGKACRVGFVYGIILALLQGMRRLSWLQP